VPHLVNYFLGIIATEYGQPKKSIEKDALAALHEYVWSGNIRELRNVVERLIIFSGKSITMHDIENYVLPGKR
jgi:DNA-binding NtrC family response regulator